MLRARGDSYTMALYTNAGLTHFPLKEVGVILEVYFSNSFL